MGVSAKTYIIYAGKERIEVTRKNVRGFRMRLAADGTIKLSAPYLATDAQIERFAMQNRAWITRAAERAASSPLHAEYRDGGTIMVWGEPLTICVEMDAARSRAAYRDGASLITPLSPKKSTREGIEAACRAYLAAEVARAMSSGVIERMEERVGVHAQAWRVRSMTSRWGSCNTRTGVITVNSRLAHLDPRYLDYVVCHELCHLIEPSHNARFHALMDKNFPGWKDVRRTLRP